MLSYYSNTLFIWEVHFQKLGMKIRFPVKSLLAALWWKYLTTQYKICFLLLPTMDYLGDMGIVPKKSPKSNQITRANEVPAACR